MTVTIPEFTEYKKILQKQLVPKRYNHSLCVADEACRLAQKYGCDEVKCYLAGLLHDITKNLSKEEHLNIFNTFDIILNDVEKSAEKLWHAISGAAYIRYVLNIDDEEIIDAVRYHTTAKNNMPLMSLILYLADFTSADRDYEDVDVMRELVDNSLEEAFIYALKFTINELTDKNSAIHEDTLAAYNNIMLKRRNDI